MGVHNRITSPFYISHPVTLFTYYAVVLSYIFILKNPLVMAIVFILCALLAIYYAGFNKFIQSFKWMAVAAIVIFILNILFVHKGRTVWFYLFSSPVTKEAAVYGMYNALLILSVMTVFISFNILLDSSRFLYLFSGALPKTSFIFDMALRYIPLFQKRATELASIQKVNGQTGKQSLRQKIDSSGTYLKALTAWTLEEGMETALSLKVKNYSNKQKTRYTRYRYTLRDFIFTSALCMSAVFVYVGAFKGSTDFSFYPVTDAIMPSGFSRYTYMCAIIAVLLPFVLEFITALKRGIIKKWYTTN